MLVHVGVDVSDLWGGTRALARWSLHAQSISEGEDSQVMLVVVLSGHGIAAAVSQTVDPTAAWNVLFPPTGRLLFLHYYVRDYIFHFTPRYRVAFGSLRNLD